MSRANAISARFRRRAAGVIAVFCLTACSSLKVSVDYDPAVSFATLRTYAWKPEPQQKAGDTLIDTDTLLRQRLIAAIDGELARKGYLKVVQRPDFLVQFYFSSQRKIDESSYFYPYYGGYFGGPFYGYWGGWYYPGYSGYGGNYYREYEEGLLAIDFVNPTGNKLIWRGKVKDTLRYADDPQRRMQRINKAVGTVLEQFPPSPQSD